MKKTVYIVLFIFLHVCVKAQLATDLHFNLFALKNIKTVTIYFKSIDTLNDIKNDHQLLERKTDYYRNGVVKTELRSMCYEQDTCSFTAYKLNKDSTIRSEKLYNNEEHKWENGRIYKYKKNCRHPYEISRSKKFKTLYEYNSQGKIVREKKYNRQIEFGLDDYVYDSLGRLIQHAAYSDSRDRWGKRYETQHLFVFKYHYEQRADSLFCTKDEYYFYVNNKYWDKLRSDPPKEFNVKDTIFKVELRLNYEVTVFNSRYEIIGDYDCWRYRNKSHPQTKHWTRRKYVYEYY